MRRTTSLLLAGFLLLTMAPCGWPEPDQPTGSDTTAWRRTSDGWVPRDSLLRESDLLQVKPPDGVHPLSLATFQLVASLVGLIGERRLKLPSVPLDRHC